MAAARTKRRQLRRDRRKAKQSTWRRAGKTVMGKVGHGQNGGSGGASASAKNCDRPILPDEAPSREPTVKQLKHALKHKLPLKGSE
jgi:hypothetical protein